MAAGSDEVSQVVAPGLMGVLAVAVDPRSRLGKGSLP